jgi:hypothetical protein
MKLSFQTKLRDNNFSNWKYKENDTEKKNTKTALDQLARKGGVDSMPSCTVPIIQLRARAPYIATAGAQPRRVLILPLLLHLFFPVVNFNHCCYYEQPTESTAPSCAVVHGMEGSC